MGFGFKNFVYETYGIIQLQNSQVQWDLGLKPIFETY